MYSTSFFLLIISTADLIITLRIPTGTPYGQLPLLEYNGTVVSQSEAIWRLAGSIAGLVGGDELERAQQDMVVNHVKDLLGGGCNQSTILFHIDQ